MNNNTEKLEKIIAKFWPKPQELPAMCMKNVQEGDYKRFNDEKLARLLEGENADKLSVMLTEYVVYTYESVRDRLTDLAEALSGRKVGVFDVGSVGMKRIKSLGTRIRHRCELLGVSMSDCEKYVASHIVRAAIKATMDKRWRDSIRRSVMTSADGGMR